MRFLLDTCVLSELNIPRPHPSVRAAVQAVDTNDLFVSVMTMGEIHRGIEILETGKKRDALEAWASDTGRRFSDRILQIDVEIVKRWGALSGRARRKGRQVGVIDGLIAATALRHDLAVMTRNVRDFEPTGVRIVDPWTDP